MNDGFLHYTDPQGRSIDIVCVENARTVIMEYHVEVVENGEVVDHYTLYGHAALEHTSRKRGWKER